LEHCYYERFPATPNDASTAHRSERATCTAVTTIGQWIVRPTNRGFARCGKSGLTIPTPPSKLHMRRLPAQRDNKSCARKTRCQAKRRYKCVQRIRRCGGLSNALPVGNLL
jgi:hypothetical protein